MLCEGRGNAGNKSRASKPHSLATAPITPHTPHSRTLSLPFCDVVCVQAALDATASTNGSMTLLGQSINLTSAKDKSTADKDAEARRQKHDQQESRRNLHLAKLGLKASGDEGFEELPLQERRKREDAWAQKKEKLKSPNFLVSDVRLSIRNLPPAIDEDKLRSIALSAAASSSGASSSKRKAAAAADAAGPPKIRQVKIIRDEQRLDERGTPRSRGFGFVQFESHEHALSALNAMADNDNLLPHGRRLLVEFAVDNVQKLKALEGKKERGAGGGGRGGGKGGKGAAAGRGKGGRGGGREQPAAEEEEGGGGGESDKGKKLSRGQRQRMRKRGEEPLDTLPAELPAAAATEEDSRRKRRKRGTEAVVAEVEKALPASSFSNQKRGQAGRGGAGATAAAASLSSGSSKRPRGKKDEFDGVLGGGKDDVNGRYVSEERSKRARKAQANSRQHAGEAKGEAHFESLVADYKKRLIGSSGGDIAKGMKEWM